MKEIYTFKKLCATKGTVDFGDSFLVLSKK